MFKTLKFKNSFNSLFILNTNFFIFYRIFLKFKVKSFYMKEILQHRHKLIANYINLHNNISKQ